MTELAGTPALLRLAMRRDRVQLPVWLLGLTVLHAISIGSTLGLYRTEAERVSLAIGSARSGVAVAFNGIVSGTSEGAIVMSQTFLSLAVGAALMSTLAVVRHTRQNEETGRAELLGAAVVGRYALLAAGLLLAASANLGLGVLQTVVLLGFGLPVAGSVVAGAGIALVGLAFAAVAAVTSQVFSHARVANGAAAAVLGVAFLARALGDSTGAVTEGGTRLESAWPSWLLPLGWGQQVRAYDDDAMGPLLLLVGWVGVLVAVAALLVAHRDLGRGLVADRLGPATASPALGSALGLAWRLQRGTLIGWAVTMVVMGTSFGALSPQVDDLVGDSEATKDLIESIGGGSSDLALAYLAATLAFVGVTVAAYAVQSLQRTRAEEVAGRLELVLATAVSRWRWLGAHVVVVSAGVVVLLALLGVSAGLVYGLAVDDVGGQAASLTGAALAYVPAVLVVTGVAVLAFGVLPRVAVAVAWGAFAATYVLGLLGELLDLPQIVRDLSPFAHVPVAPVVPVSAGPLVALALVALGLLAAGFAGFRHRDVGVG